MDNFQRNWPPFWGYIFYFPLTTVAHLVSVPHTEDNPYGHLLPWQREAIPWMFYYLLGVRSALHQALVSLSVCLVSAISSPSCHYKVSKCEIYVLLLSASQLVYASFMRIASDRVHVDTNLILQGEEKHAGASCCWQIWFQSSPNDNK